MGEYCGTAGKPGGEESLEGVEVVEDEGDGLELPKDGVLDRSFPGREAGGEVGGFSSSRERSSSVQRSLANLVPAMLCVSKVDFRSSTTLALI